LDIGDEARCVIDLPGLEKFVGRAKRQSGYTAEAIADRLTIRKWVSDARKLSG
jgi:hypothetical protein